MGGDPYFSHLSSPPPPGLPIFTLHTPSFFLQPLFQRKIYILYSSYVY